jgi:hypothetical protein
MFFTLTQLKGGAFRPIGGVLKSCRMELPGMIENRRNRHQRGHRKESKAATSATDRSGTGGPVRQPLSQQS